MPPTQLQHRRTHNLLLLKKLLDGRDSASPLTLVLDSLEQSSRPLLREFIAGANRLKAKSVWVSLETLRAPKGVDVFLAASTLNLPSLAKEVNQHVISTSEQRTLVIIDALNVLLHQVNASSELPSLLSSLVSPTTSVIAVYHLDVPVPHDERSYSPPPLTLLKYLATAVLVTHSLSHLIAAKEARSRSVAEPGFGLSEGKEGVIVGLGSNDLRGVVIEMEYRRKSGRAVHEVFFVPRRSTTATGAASVTLLDDQTDYKLAGGYQDITAGADSEQGSTEGTFSLSLTEKQRRDREGVVLPYFDAQRDGGVGEGGRILYEMGIEDDFDEEEDEI